MASTINAKNTSTGVVITPDASGQLELQTADTTRMTITSGGYVGIGASTPTAKLHVSGISLGNSNIRLTNTFTNGRSWELNPYASGVSDVPFTIRDVTAGADRITIDSSGNVGIGTTSPQFKFNADQLTATAAPSLLSTPQIYVKGFAGSGQQYSGIGFAMYEHSNGYWGSGIIARDDTAFYGSGLSFYTSTGSATPTPTERLRISSTGSFSAVIPSGSTLYPAFMCRAWVNFNGTGTVAIRASGNVSSITDNGTGNYTVNFTTAMPDGSYSVSGMGSHVNGSISSVYLGSMVVGSAQVVCQQSGGFVDPVVLCITIMR